MLNRGVELREASCFVGSFEAYVVQYARIWHRTAFKMMFWFLRLSFRNHNNCHHLKEMIFCIRQPTFESAIGLSLREGRVGLIERLTVRATHEGEFALACRRQ